MEKNDESNATKNEQRTKQPNTRVLCVCKVWSLHFAPQINNSNNNNTRVIILNTQKLKQHPETIQYST